MQLKRETDPKRSLSVQGAAERLRVHPNTIYRLIQSGSLPASKQAGRWLVAADDLYRYSSGKNSWLSNLQLARHGLDGIRRLLETTQLPMGITDAEGYFLGVNDAYRDVLGYSRSWFHNHTYLDYAAQEGRLDNEKHCLRAMTQPGVSTGYLKKAVTSSGAIVLIDFQVVAARIDADPQSTQVVCLATNIKYI
jgi:excisionase family DNA binding protein/PAS domain S-box-containing protein